MEEEKEGEIKMEEEKEVEIKMDMSELEELTFEERIKKSFVCHKPIIKHNNLYEEFLWFINCGLVDVKLEDIVSVKVLHTIEDDNPYGYTDNYQTISLDDFISIAIQIYYSHYEETPVVANIFVYTRDKIIYTDSRNNWNFISTLQRANTREVTTKLPVNKDLFIVNFDNDEKIV